ncbi:dihydrofolate reductase-like domain-containing protein [Rhexocercosporidium sp. MPI-PUGE-AT-0058]|nr:dihydrofolate reductase-like domain-containing protein [Rhexocercosporidium sp. MPI-PUGE-AT-0058]
MSTIFSSTANDSTMAPRELTLIVAATNNMGIGRAGTLPWTGLKKEMAYFARVTKRASPGNTNTVIMGHKTWESIPSRFRPLKDRINVVITRGDPQTVAEGQKIVANSMYQAVDSAGAQAGNSQSKLFVIGGAQIYKASLESEDTKRILLTRILGDFECDTFFPITLGEDGKASGWVRKSKEDLDHWTGETVPGGIQEENGTKYIFEMWEKP